MIHVVKSDITQMPVDVIVNAANQAMLGGMGVDGAIHLAAGLELRNYCASMRMDEQSRRCPTGESRITPGFEIPAKWIVHTVGPVWDPEDPLWGYKMLENAYRSALDCAVSLGAHSVALPAISCGIYRFPAQKAAQIAMKVLKEFEGRIDDIYMVLFMDDLFEIFQREYQGL